MHVSCDVMQILWTMIGHRQMQLHALGWRCNTQKTRNMTKKSARSLLTGKVVIVVARFSRKRVGWQQQQQQQYDGFAGCIAQCINYFYKAQRVCKDCAVCICSLWIISCICLVKAGFLHLCGGDDACCCCWFAVLWIVQQYLYRKFKSCMKNCAVRRAADCILSGLWYCSWG